MRGKESKRRPAFINESWRGALETSDVVTPKAKAAQGEERARHAATPPLIQRLTSSPRPSALGTADLKHMQSARREQLPLDHALIQSLGKRSRYR